MNPFARGGLLLFLVCLLLTIILGGISAFRDSYAMTGWRSRFYRLGIILFFGGGLNFAIFAMECVLIGGDAATHGSIIDGRYYVRSQAHGQYKEVSKQVYNFNRYHAISLFVTHPLAIIGGGSLLNLERGKNKRRKPRG